MPRRTRWADAASDSSDESGLALWTRPRATRRTSEEEPPARAGVSPDADEPLARAGAVAEASDSEDPPPRRRTKPVLTPAANVARRRSPSPAHSRSPSPPARAGAKGSSSARRGGVRFREEAEVREYVPESEDSWDPAHESADDWRDEWPSSQPIDAEGWWDASRWRHAHGRWWFRSRGTGPQAGGRDCPRSANPSRTARNARRKAKKLIREEGARAEGETRPRKMSRTRSVDSVDI